MRPPMLQLIFVVFLLSASGEKTEQRYIYRDQFRSVEACKAKGSEIVAQMARVREPLVAGFAFVCVNPGPGV